MQEDLNKNVLLANIRNVLEKNKFQQKAIELQKEILKCDGLATATKIITEAALKSV